MEEIKTPKKRGFATMDPQRQREIASMAGKKAHETGKAHKFDSKSGKAAAKKRMTNRAAKKTGV